MSKDRPEADDAASTAAAVPETLTFGDEERPARPALRWLAGLRDDRRIAPVAAGLGAVALVVSLLAEWQVTSVHQGLFGGDEEAATRSLTTGVGDLGGWTGCYLAGLFVLAGVVTLLLFGPRPGRAYARLVALSTGAVLAVVLLTLSGRLADSSFALPAFLTLDIPPGHIEVARGRGVWCALAGVLILTLAAWLARVPAEPPPAAAPGPGGEPRDEAADDWPWRRPHDPAPVEDDDLPPPPDLTVGPATPFPALPQDRDTPNGDGPRGQGHIG